MKHPMPETRSSRRAQRGVVLIVGLLLLLVLTLIGVTSMRSALLEERMTGNVQDSTIAFQAAEAALREGELLLQQPTLPSFDGSDGLYPPPAPPPTPPRWKSINWQADGAIRIYDGFDDAPASLARVSARYFIEEEQFVIGPGESLSVDTPLDEVGFYRITARGVGVTGNTAAVLQSTYKR
jgi:type IV pilus assembly protein PilX